MKETTNTGVDQGPGRGQRWEAASSFPIKVGWNVRVQLFYADDYAVVLLNDTPVLDISFGEAEKDPVDLQSILKTGENSLRVICYNYHPNFWSLRFRIGVFDAAGKPTMDAIDLSPKGTTPHQGAQYDVTYSFPRS